MNQKFIGLLQGSFVLRATLSRNGRRAKY
ncbi:hypothetical protein OOU_Y34scaffold00911g4 [Pyricularia oryzae Y34]|uniref:Uncharacterized protein n=2 Tax=Pyricularia oryzae TaxID=318829 RepID=A0AA97PGE8_PYRO3|nr:hypothetical protein OOU_Y34scaffold00911g4 [Pyricularia oryzae Y34]